MCPRKSAIIKLSIEKDIKKSIIQPYLPDKKCGCSLGEEDVILKLIY